MINFVLGSNLMNGSSIFYWKFLKLDLMVVMEFDQCPRAWPQRSKTIVSYFFVNVFFSWLQLDQSSQSQEIGEFFRWIRKCWSNFDQQSVYVWLSLLERFYYEYKVPIRQFINRKGRDNWRLNNFLNIK